MHELLKQNSEIWDHFTRKEEYSPEKLDEHGRFLYVRSKFRQAFEPGVSRYLCEARSAVNIAKCFEKVFRAQVIF